MSAYSLRTRSRLKREAVKKRQLVIVMIAN